MLAWQVDHRRNSPYPLRHNATNVHITSSTDAEASYRSYIFVTHIVDGRSATSQRPVPRHRPGGGRRPRIAEMRVILDTTDSDLFIAATRGDLV